MNTKSRKTSAEAQIPQTPSEEDFVGLIKYVKEREESLSRYSDKLRQKLQRIFDVFGNLDYCQICDCSFDSEKHIQYRDMQGYLKRQKMDTINGITVTYEENKNYSHAFVPKIHVSENVEDTEVCMETRENDNDDFERYRLVFCDGKLRLKGWRNCEIDETGVTTWLTTPEGTQRGGTPSRAELKQLVHSGRLPKFLALAAQKLSEAEAEYSQVAKVAEKMAKAIEQTDVAQHTNAIAKREGAEEVGQ